MVAILRQLEQSAAFEPEAINAMSTAFELSCADLHVFAGDELARRIIATRIIDLARNGVIDAEALHQRVVAESHLGL